MRCMTVIGAFALGLGAACVNGEALPRADGTTRTTATTIPANDLRLVFSGYADIAASASKVTFDRVLKDWPYARDNPGVCIEFATDAAGVSVLLDYVAKGQMADKRAYHSLGVCLIDGRPARTFDRISPEGGAQRVELLRSDRGGRHTYQVLLPYGDTVEFLGLRLTPGGSLEPAKRKPRPRYVAYGDSITQGFWASRPDKTYAWLTAERLGFQLIDFGFGSRRATPSDGVAVAALKPEIVTILIGVNDCLGNVPLADFEANHRGIVAGIRTTCPDVPLYAITPLSVPGKGWKVDRLEEYRRAIRKAVAERNDPKLYLIEGPELIPSQEQYFQDGLHPNDAGFTLMAKNLAKAMTARSNEAAGQ